MLRDSMRAMFNDAQRGDDRAGLDCASGKPPVLRRRTIRLAAALIIAGIVYGSLAPFQINPAAAWSWSLRPSELVPGDAVSNLLIYVPVGLCARLLVRRRSSSRLFEWAFGLLLPLGLSYLTEATQTILLNRVSSWYDVAYNTFGAAIGVTLAPLAQRILRNQHAWLYQELRRRPFAAAAVGMAGAIFFAGLMPFDLAVTPGHLARGVAHVGSALGWAPFATAPDDVPGIRDLIAKLTSASTYGVLSFLLVLAAAQQGRNTRAALLYAFPRAAGLAALLEAAQLLTVSHVADPWDLLAAIAAAILGSTAAAVALRHSAGLHPRLVLSAVAGMMAIGAVARMLMAFAPYHGASAGTSMQWWLPMAGQFNRPWRALLGSYSSSLLLYLVIAGLGMLRCRAIRRPPSLLLLGSLAFTPVYLGALAAIALHRPFDTAHVILAGLAACIVLGVDRALFTTAQPVQVPMPDTRVDAARTR